MQTNVKLQQWLVKKSKNMTPYGYYVMSSLITNIIKIWIWPCLYKHSLGTKLKLGVASSAVLPQWFPVETFVKDSQLTHPSKQSLKWGHEMRNIRCNLCISLMHVNRPCHCSTQESLWWINHLALGLLRSETLSWAIRRTSCSEKPRSVLLSISATSTITPPLSCLLKNHSCPY